MCWKHIHLQKVVTQALNDMTILCCGKLRNNLKMEEKSALKLENNSSRLRLKRQYRMHLVLADATLPSACSYPLVFILSPLWIFVHALLFQLLDLLYFTTLFVVHTHRKQVPSESSESCEGYYQSNCTGSGDPHCLIPHSSNWPNTLLVLFPSSYSSTPYVRSEALPFSAGFEVAIAATTTCEAPRRDLAKILRISIAIVTRLLTPRSDEDENPGVSDGIKVLASCLDSHPVDLMESPLSRGSQQLTMVLYCTTTVEIALQQFSAINKNS